MSEPCSQARAPWWRAWEQRKLGELCEINSGRDYKHLGEGPIPVYGTGGYMLSVDEALSYDRDAVGIGRKGTIDKPYKLRAPFWTVDTLFYCIPEESVDLGFLEGLFLNVDWASKDESTGLPSLSKAIIGDVDVLVPETTEQIAISGALVSLDNLITLHLREPPAWLTL
ncbi:MAG: restriction endonuclease subunit S [Acidobacteriota bacterium]|nr:restriction endonuclease subunit S [Acidobacteriota bacterium]